MMADYDIQIAPVLHTINAGLIVTRPFGDLIACRTGKSGAISVGAAHLPNYGPALVLAVTSRDGEALTAVLGMAAYGQLAKLVNDAVTDISVGRYDRPEVRQ